MTSTDTRTERIETLRREIDELQKAEADCVDALMAIPAPPDPTSSEWPRWDKRVEFWERKGLQLSDEWKEKEMRLDALLAKTACGNEACPCYRAGVADTRRTVSDWHDARPIGVK